MIDWSKMQTAEERAAEALAARRSSASLTRREFCLAMVSAGILAPADAVAAARGEWPGSMADFLLFLTEAESADAQIEWAAAGHIDRLAPLVLVMGSWIGLTDAALDTIFGISAA